MKHPPAPRIFCSCSELLRAGSREAETRGSNRSEIRIEHDTVSRFPDSNRANAPLILLIGKCSV